MSKKPKAKPKDVELLCVRIGEAKPNPMFSEEQRAWIRFLTFNRCVVCQACGKKKRGMWTMLCEFRASDMGANVFVLQNFPKIFAPLTPVCSIHPIAPAFAEVPEQETKKE